MSGPCPATERLAATIRDSQSSVVDAELAAHVGECSNCQAQLEVMAGGVDWLIARLRSHGRATSAASAVADKSGAREPERSPFLDRAMEDLECRAGRQVGPKTDPLLSPGTNLKYFGNYEIMEELGRGGMGVVYRARQVRLNRSVALKLILAGQLASESEVRRFRTEAEAAAMLDHPNIVPIYEIGEHEGRHYFSMKLVEGRALSERIANAESESPSEKPGGGGVAFDPQNSALMVSQVARAVHYAHQRGVLHRDLKPSNILLDAQGQPHLTDFGLAKMLERDSGLTLSGAIMGTPSYLAPELAAGKAKELTTAADIYSLGAILFELLTGRPPFQAETVAATLQQVLNAEPPRPRSLNPAVPRDLEIICLKCLGKESSHRYASAQSLADDLECFSRGEPITARSVGPTERLWRWCRRKPALAAALAALLLALSGGIGGVLWQWRRAERHAVSEGQQLARAERALLQVEVERVELLLNQGRSELPLAHLARLVRQHPDHRALGARLAAALSARDFCLPATLPLAHEEEIHSVCFSPDGRQLVTASADKTARLWDAESGQLLFVMAHNNVVNQARFSPDGRLVATASEDRTARIWDAATGLLHAPVLAHTNPVSTAQFSPDGRLLATATTTATRLWDVHTGQPTTPIMGQRNVIATYFSSDGKHLVSSSQNGPVRFWEAATGREAARPITNTSTVKDAKFTPDGDRVLVANHRFVNWRTGRPLDRQIETKSFKVHSSDFSPDGRRLLVARADHTAQVWDLQTLQPLTPLMLHDHQELYGNFSPDGNKIVTAGRDNAVRVWDAWTAQPLTEPLRHDTALKLALFSPDGSRLVTLPKGNQVWLWDVRLQRPVAQNFQHQRSTVFVHFSKDGRRLLTASMDYTACLWDVEQGRLAIPPLAHKHWVNSAEFSPDEELIVTSSYDRTARVWDARTGSLVSQLTGYGSEVRTAEFSPDGQRVVTAAYDGTVRVHVARTGELVWRKDVGNHPESARFSPDGRRILFATGAYANVFDAATGEPVFSRPLRHELKVRNAVFTPDGKKIVTVGEDETARVWDARTGMTLLEPVKHAANIARRTPHFTRDGSRVVTAAGNSAIVWDITTGEPVVPALTHAQLVRSARFSPDGQLVVTTSADNTARVWDALTGLPVTDALRHRDRVTCAEFSPDGRWVVTGADDGSTVLWEVPSLEKPPGFLPELAEALVGQRLNAKGQLENVSPETLLRLKQDLARLPETNWYARWGRWLVADRPARRISPSSPISLAEYIDRQVQADTAESIRNAALLAPTNAVAQARLARHLIERGQPSDPQMSINAEWSSRYATNLASGNREVLHIRAGVILFFKQGTNNVTITNAPHGRLNIRG